MKIVHQWLQELVDVPDDAEAVAAAIALRGFEVASVERGLVPPKPGASASGEGGLVSPKPGTSASGEGGLVSPKPGTSASGEGGRLAVIDFEITANRPDCLNHLGIAREASVIWSTPVRPLALDAAISGDASIDVDLQAPDLCPRYCAQVFEVRIAPSPAWLAERLEAAGVRPISNIVDVTNYVMLEMGQPMHAFDLARLGGGRLVVRRAAPGEMLTTLDGVERRLGADMLVIADAERATALGGVMGGSASEIHAGTTRMVLESAYFHPASVRRTSKTLNLKTEASTRFERGGDIASPPTGLSRAAALFEKIGAGRAIGPMVDRYPSPRPVVSVGLRPSRVARLLGQQVPSEDVPRLLEPLGFKLASAPDGWLVSVPTWRVDVAREADLIEEVGRHFGFDRIPAAFPPLAAAQPAPDRAITRERILKDLLTAGGFSEAMTFAFVEREAALPFCADGADPAAIANPLSEKYAVLRPSLLPGLIDACAHNRRRGRKDIRLFETGSRFVPGAGEGRAAAVAWCGAADEAHWSADLRPVDFFDLKGIVERACATYGVRPEFAEIQRAFLLPGRAAEVSVETGATRVSIAVIGQLVPSIAEARGFPAAEELYIAEIDMAALFSVAAGDDLRAESLPRYPSIVRDLSILVPDTLPAATVRGTIRSSAPPTLVSIVEFDRYTGKGVPAEQVSLSLRLTFRAPDRTLTDDEVQMAMAAILVALSTSHGATQR